MKTKTADVKMEIELVDSKSLAALEKADITLANVAKQLAKTCKEFGAASSTSTFGFLKEDEEADAQFIAKLSVTVERV